RPAMIKQVEQSPFIREVSEHIQYPFSFEHNGWQFYLDIRTDKESAVKPMTRYEAVFDLEQLDFPLMFRTRLAGDRMQVLGLNGSKKVQDMFVDAKIAPSKRDTYPLLLDRNARILWIPGIRRSNHGLVS